MGRCCGKNKNSKRCRKKAGISSRYCHIHRRSTRPNLNDTSVEHCTICLDVLPLQDISLVVLDCEHVFHKACITKWLRVKATCPNCRKAHAVTPHKRATTDDDGDEEYIPATGLGIPGLWRGWRRLRSRTRNTRSSIN